MKNRRLGRPSKPPTARRVALGTRVSATVKKRLIALSHEGGRTISQEVERLLEQALRDEDRLQRIGARISAMERSLADGLSKIAASLEKAQIP